MNICLLKYITKCVGICFITLLSLFDFGYEENDKIVNNDVILKNSYFEVEILEYETHYNYDSSLPNTYQEVIVEGLNGVSSNNIVISEPVDEIIEIGTGKNGVYQGMLTGYGPDCIGCSLVGNVACYTKNKEIHSLINDGIYYEDEEYGLVRILAADHREFPCGTIIEISNDMYDKEVGVVLDTGSGMRNAYENGWILIDLAFEKESQALTVTNKKTDFVVKRWGW